ncbi:2-keto-4-pentenoate hydratase/2-oxohepta-3-ene-1,7-dioic acid hydratase (catechol pathway) [Solimonas aquatica]|uniref:2-keto-4-pentenoate hydratase/2-oxohepta-3-ene-1,7-dioic acid hydratase (Catechol pathway) n=1 Tax=Solimonas aquatica TaxID=489703 RepID=A0A1H9ABC8_9GAMM|nr:MULTISPECIES: fumarylacetoacetate hydrolase family protein [Hydrocarboniphaga]MDZ4078027.1 fumarylacetoacetate hydrolase family protein [Hydrocarboniphaga sp.]SEP73969.1 2-keto-4-pentenoate hydratase/2-oxohepta-3-ene-1,7-dioic acid hydratase (catechol pathway) [Solimonas aquatica]
MKICRFNGNRLGVLVGDGVLDVTPALAAIPLQHWPLAQGDPLILHFDTVLERVRELLPEAPRLALDRLALDSPVANPGKIVNAPINYRAHIDETSQDAAIAHGRDMTRSIWDWGLFLKASSALIGPSEQIRLRFPDRRNDHEVELAVVIGRRCHQVSREEALNYVAGYAIGLDITIRGPELQSFRKSPDTYAVCGPWLATRDEIPDPGVLDLRLWVNNELRQSANTRQLIYDVPRLIEYASSFYTLHPGDLIFTGTPEGVGPLLPGDRVDAEIAQIGRFSIQVADRYV